MRHDAQIAVVDVLVVIVLDLHDLVARTERPAKALNAGVAWRIQDVLKLDIQGAGTETAAVHRAEHLDVAYRVEPEALRNALLDDRQHLPDTLFRVGCVDKIESLVSAGVRLGIRPSLMRCALMMISLSAAWRKTSVRRTTGMAPDAMTSANTCPGPTEGN